MFTRILLAGLLAILLSCKKENDKLPERLSATALLTQKQWILSVHGLDENGNNKIDAWEEAVEDCQKDNITHFYPDGTGLVDDNTLSCGNGIEKQYFNWQFTEDGTAIDFRYDSLKIHRLNDRELVLYKQLFSATGDTIKLILVYRH